MKKLLFILAFLLIPMTAYSTTVTVAANSIANFQPTGLANDVTLSNVSVTNGFTTVSCSACFRPQWVGLSGFRIAISGVDYTVAGVTSTSVLTITTPYAGTTGSDKTVTWYKYVEVRIYADRAFQPAGASYVVQPGVPGSTSWYKRFAASIVNASGVNTLYIPEFTIDSTTDAVGPTNQARYTAGFYRPDGSLVQLYSCFEQFRVPATTPTTWVALCQYNSPPAIVPPANEAYTKAQIDARFPSCTSGQMLYYAATGNAQACLNVGSGLTISSGTITAAGSTNIRNALNAVVDYGAVGDGVTDDTTAIQNCIDASEASGGYPCYIRAGTYLVTGLTLSDNGNIIGDGKTKTTIYSTTNSPLISTPTTANDASIRSIGFKGTKAAGSSQVGIQLDGSTYYYNLIIEDVKIEETGSFGLNVLDPFSSSFRDIFIDDTAGFALNYDAPVAPSNTFSNIYVGVVNVGATVGFRIRSGDFVCTECNGVNSSPAGGAWATVGKKNGVDGDTVDSAARFTCIHCNLESFAAYGIIAYNASKINLLGNTTIAGGGAGTEIALYFDNTGDGATGCTPSPACEYYSQFIARGYIDDTVDISDGYAAYANSQPIHTAKGFPAIQLLGQGPNVAGGLKLSTYRNDTTGTVEKLSRADGKVSIQAISTTTTIANPGVRYIEADSSGGAITITIPWGGWYQEAQEPLIIKDVGGAASSFNITLNVGSGANIGSSASLVMNQNGQTVILMPSGSTGTGAWRILYDSSDSGGITGSGSAGYVTIWNGASAVTYDSLYYDTTNNRLSVNAGTSPTYTIEANLSTGATIAATSTTNSVIAGLQADGANSRAVVGALSGHSTALVASGTEAIRLDASTRFVGINNTGPTSQLDVKAANTLTNPLTVRDSSSVALVDISPYGRQTHVVQNENAVGGNGYFAFQNGNQTGLTSGAGVVGMTYDLGGTRDWTGSVPATQREVYYYAPVYSATSTSTMTNAVTLGIDGPPTAGTNVTITNAYALEVASGHFKLGGSTSASELRFLEPSGSGANYTAFKAQAQSGNVTYTLPAADGTSGYCLSTNGSGTLSWVSCAGGGGTPGGSDTQLQRNNAGSFGGISGATSDGTNVTFGSANLRATRPRFTTSIDDSNGNESLILTATGSAVNELTLANAATGSNPQLSATGGDTNVGIDLLAKGAAAVSIRGNATQAGELRLYEGTGAGTDYAAIKAQAMAASRTWIWPSTFSTGVQCLADDGSGNLAWAACSGGGGGGTVTSVALSLPSFITVSGSPVTTSGTLTGTLATQVANTVFAGPTTGADAAPTFRALVAADIPDISATYQPLDADLTAYAALGTTGLVARTGAGTVSTRTITGTTNRITVTNGDGVSGNPTLDVGSDVVTLTGTQTLTNKTLTAPVIATISNSGTITIPTGTDTLVGRATTDTLTNKTFRDNSFTITDQTDTSKAFVFEASGITTATTRTLTIPNASTTLVGTDATQTLTNKTLTAPVISTISNTGTLTLPTSTDTLVGRATTDTFTNKTMTASSNVLGGVTMTLGSDGTGDIYYRAAGGALTRLAAGTNGYVLTLSAGLPAWAAPTGGVSDGDKGDITVSASGATWTIDNSAVTLAKMANIAAATFIGRTTAGTGVPEALTTAQATALLDAMVGDSGSGGTKGLVPAPASGDAAAGKFLKADGTWVTPSSGGVVDGDYGDITVSSSGATWTIDNTAVTYAKIQNVSATDRILGRDTAGAGVIEELTASNVLDMIGGTQGMILYRSASGWAALSPGTSGQVLQTNGAAANPSWVTPAGGASLTNTYVGYGDGSNNLTGENTFTYSASSDTLSVTKTSLAGLTLTAGSGNEILTLDMSGEIATDDTLTHTYYGLFYEPVLNGGASNLNKTFNAFYLNTANTSTIGITTNLLNIRYGGTARLVLSSAGLLTLTGTGYSGVGTSLTNLDASNVTQGSLGDARLSSNVVLESQANTWTTGAQSFSSATSLVVPTSAGAAPTTSATIAYDSTSHVWKGGVNGATVELSLYDVGGSIISKPSVSQVVLRFVAPRAFNLLTGTISNGTNAPMKAGTSATAQADFILAKNGSTICTLRFAAAATQATYQTCTATDFAAGDVLTLTAPSSQDATLADIGFTFPGKLK